MSGSESTLSAAEQQRAENIVSHTACLPAFGSSSLGWV